MSHPHQCPAIHPLGGIQCTRAVHAKGEQHVCGGIAWHDQPRIKVYIDTRDWWLGYYRGPNHHYVIPLIPCVVIRWPRRRSR